MQFEVDVQGLSGVQRHCSVSVSIGGRGTIYLLR